MLPWQPIKLRNSGKSLMKCGELFNHISVKVKFNYMYPQHTEIANFHFSQYKSMESLSCHSNESSWKLKIKNIFFVEGNVLSMYAKFQLHPYGF